MSDELAGLWSALAGRYTIERELGRGGMALVFLAWDLKHERPVAIKTLRPELSAALGAERFTREIAIAAKLSHPNILPLLDSGEAGGILYYVMPFVEGESLRDRLEREGPLPLEDALAITQSVATALAYAHGIGVVHRDVKPENILLSGGAVAVADFGIARAVTAAGGDRLTETGIAVGTPTYMSPEQATGEAKVDGRSDVYSLGCVLYELLSGAPPYTGPTAQAVLARRLTDPVPPLRTVRETVPVSIERATMKALARVPGDRFPTATLFAEALAAGATSVEGGGGLSATVVRRVSFTLAAIAAVALAGIVARRAFRSTVDPDASVIAVLPFTPGTSDTALTRLGTDLMITVSSTLDQVGELHTVDRYRVLMMAQPATAYPIDQAAVMSRRLGAGSFVQGSVVREGAEVRLQAGIYRTDTHAPLGPVIEVRASPESLTALSDSLTWALLRQVWRAGTPPSPSLADVTTHSLPALRDFLEGEREVVADHWTKAAEAFHRAALTDTSFWVAAWRFNQAQGWLDQDDDTTLKRRYESHLSAFQPRDRFIIEAEETSATESFAAHLARFQRLAEQFPDDWVSWFAYGDHLVHAAPLIGHDKAETRAALERAVSLNPSLTPAWQHLLFASLGQDSLDTRMAIDAWARLGGLREWSATLGYDGGLLIRLVLSLQSSGGRLTGPLGDSVVSAVAASERGHGLASFFLTIVGFPQAQRELNRRVLLRDTSREATAIHERGSIFALAARGAWDSALVALGDYATRYPERASAVDEYRFAVVAAWLGAVDVKDAERRRDAAARGVDGLQGPGRAAQARATLAWGDGIVALLGSDRGALASARDAIRASGAPGWMFLDRSLAAMALERGGLRAAAESLASIDDQASETALFSDRDPYARSLDHLAAARALVSAGDTIRAERQLTWVDADVNPLQVVGALFAGLADLELARLEEAQGSRTRARQHYLAFLQRYDMPTPAHQGLVTEARAALRRLAS